MPSSLPMTARARVAWNSGFILASQVLSRLCTLVTLKIITHGLGETGYGDYVFVEAFVGFFAIPADFRLSTLLVREVAKDRTQAGRYLATVLWLKAGLGVVTAAVLVGAAAFLPGGGVVRLAVYVAGLSILLGSLHETYQAVFQAFERMEFMALTSFLLVLLTMFGAWWVVAHDAQLLALWWVRVGAAAVAAAVAGLIVAWRFVPRGGKGRERKLGNWETGKLGCEARETGPNFLISQFPNFLKAHASRITLLSGWDRALAGALLKEAVPFVILGALGVVHFRTDVVLLRTWCGAAEAGYYGVGYRLTEMLIAADAALLTAVFPAFAHKAETAPDSFVFGFQRLMKYCLLVALPLAVGVTLLAEPLIVLLSDASYLPGAVALRLTIWVVALSFLNGVMYNALYAVRRQVCVLGLFAVATVVNLGLNALLVPGHGLFGAGLTKVASELVCFGLALFFAARHVARVPLLENLPKPLLATGVMGLAVAACTRVSWLLAVPVGAAVYVAVLFALRPFDDSDRAVWRDIVKRKA